MIPLDTRRSNKSILKEVSLEYALEGLMLKLKLESFGHLMRRMDLLEKTLMLGKTEGKRRGDDSSVQFSRSVVSDSLRPHGPQHARLPCPSPTPGLMSMESVMPSNHLTLCRPLLLLPSVLPSIRVFPSESALCIRGPKYWSFSFSISPPNEYSRLIPFRMDWLDLLVVQGTLKSSLQCHGFNKSKYIRGVFLGGGELAEGIKLCWEDLRAVCRGSPFSVEEEREFTQNRR